MLSFGLMLFTAYAIVRLVMVAPDFVKYGGNKWQLAALLVLAIVALGTCVLPLVPMIPHLTTGMAVASQITCYGALAVASRRMVLIFEACGTALADKVEHVSNALLLASILAVLRIVAKCYTSWAGLT